MSRLREVFDLRNWTPAQVAVGGCGVFGALWAVIEFGLGASLQRGYNPMEVVWWRYGVHLILLVGICSMRRPATLVVARRPILQIARSLLMVVMPASFVIGVYSGVPHDFIWSVFWTSPILIVLFAWMLLGERPSWPMLLIAMASACVAAVIHGQLRHVSALGIACALGMTLSFVFYLIGARLLRVEHVATNLFYTAFLPFIALSAYMPMIWMWPSFHDAVLMTAVGVAGLVGLWAIDVAAHAAPAGMGAPGLFAQPAAGVVMAAGIGVHQYGRDIAGAAALAVLVAAAWLWAGRGRAGSEKLEASGTAA